MKKHVKKIVALICVLAMLVPTCSFATADTKATEEIGPKVGSLFEFGSYPQTEIVANSNQCGTKGQAWSTYDDCIIDEALYEELKGESWDDNNNATVNGNRYHRMKKEEATYFYNGRSANLAYYKWSDDTTYHYFKYEPIKWRVLEKDYSNNEIFIMSDIGLYNLSYTDTYGGDWQGSNTRSWLNDDFYNDAFDSAEKEAINSQEIEFINSENNKSSTQDRIFLLSVENVKDSKYGFDEDGDKKDSARLMKSSTYSKAMGTSNSDDGICSWWLRDNEWNSNYTASQFGIITSINGRNDATTSVVPAMHLNLDYFRPEPEPEEPVVKVTNYLMQGVAAKKKITYSWDNVPGATTYKVYQSKCGKKYKNVKTTSATTFTKKKLKKGTAYKAYVVAYDGAGNQLAKSPAIHIMTKKGKKSNATAVSANATATIAVGMTANVGAKITNKDSKKAIIWKKHVSAKIRYYVDDTSIATVDASGNVVGVAAGKTTVYAVAPSGTYAKTAITVAPTESSNK